MGLVDLLGEVESRIEEKIIGVKAGTESIRKNGKTLGTSAKVDLLKDFIMNICFSHFF